MSGWLKHKNRFIMYLIMKKKDNQSGYVWDMKLMQKQIQQILSKPLRRRM